MKLSRRFLALSLTSMTLASLSFGGASIFKSSANSAFAADQKAMLPFFGNTIADMAEKAAPAVVNLDMRKSRTLNTSSLPPDLLNMLPQFYFQGRKISPEDLKQMENNLPQKHDTASGFIIKSDGYILTNAHAVDGEGTIKVTLNDKRSFDAKVVGMDYFSDLAVVKIDAKDLDTIPWGSSSVLRPGEFAVAIGSPLGYDHTVTLGIISAVGRTVTDVNGNINFIQTDAAINPGNSGGPLLNLSGEVIGVNTAIRRDAQNIGFSIPVDVAKSVAEELIKNGSVSRPWLGVVMKEMDETTIKSLGLQPSDSSKGVLISGFVQGSPGQASGLQANDIILKIDGKEMKLPKDVKDYVQGHKVGDILNFMVMRNSQSQAIAVNVGTYPHDLNVNRGPMRRR
ncbi:MAG: trypsin-like peptidase domain-containing protein [Candidatus Obscuribacterales bacterium]|jgi:S1-C subfamily serine protease|nr:trypsin-like peptidase domain-containing protein [Candidatus Obscuribacterales bacterium]